MIRSNIKLPKVSGCYSLLSAHCTRWKSMCGKLFNYCNESHSIPSDMCFSCTKLPSTVPARLMPPILPFSTKSLKNNSKGVDSSLPAQNEQVSTLNQSASSLCLCVCVRHEEITRDYDAVIILRNVRNCFVINKTGNPLTVQSILVKITILNHRPKLVQISSNLLRHRGTDGQ